MEIVDEVPAQDVELDLGTYAHEVNDDGKHTHDAGMKDGVAKHVLPPNFLLSAPSTRLIAHGRVGVERVVDVGRTQAIPCNERAGKLSTMVARIKPCAGLAWVFYTQRPVVFVWGGIRT